MLQETWYEFDCEVVKEYPQLPPKLPVDTPSRSKDTEAPKFSPEIWLTVPESETLNVSVDVPVGILA